MEWLSVLGCFRDLWGWLINHRVPGGKCMEASQSTARHMEKEKFQVCWVETSGHHHADASPFPGAQTEQLRLRAPD